METNNALYFKLSEDKENLGESRFFGCPDLPDDFEWPQDPEGFDLEFICQIDLAEASKLNNLLPSQGHLYFFGCIASALGEEDAPAITEGYQPEGYFQTIYSDAKTLDLLSGEIVDENGDPEYFEPMKIEFTEDINNCPDFCHQLMGDFPDTIDTDEYLLLSVDSFSGKDFDLKFKNQGYLYFLIDKNDLKNKDFSHVKAYLKG